MYRLEYNFTEEDGEVRKESIIVDKPFVTLADDDRVDIALDKGTLGRYTIEEAKNGQVTLREVEGEDCLIVNDQVVHAAELRDEDVVAIGDVAFTYFYIIPPTAIISRTSSPMQYISAISIGLLLTAQVVFLAWVLVFWRLGQTPLLADEPTPEEPVQVAQVSPPPEPAVQPTPAPVPSPAPTTPEPNPAPPATVPQKMTPPAQAPAPKVGEPVATEPEVVEAPPKANPPDVNPEQPSEPPAAPPSQAKGTPDPSIAPPELRPVPTPQIDKPVFPNLPDPVVAKPERPRPVPVETPESMLLRSAQDQIEKGNLIRADDYYKLLQRSNPSYLPVYSDRARLFEKRGMLKEAIDQWAQLKNKCEDETLWATLATKEHNRLQERLRALEASYSIQTDSISSPIGTKPATKPAVAVAPAPTQSAPAPQQNFVEIISAEAPQMGSGDNYAYMRILSIELASLPAGDNIRGDNVLVRVQFYDQDRLTRRIYPSEIYVPRTEFTLSGPLPSGKIHSITCPYTVPIDFREKQMAKTKQNLIYYGFTVEIFYVNHLQDYVAKPLSLSGRIKK